jgi:hypothetical protein
MSHKWGRIAPPLTRLVYRRHDRLMAHWKAALPNPILTVRLGGASIHASAILPNSLLLSFLFLLSIAGAAEFHQKLEAGATESAAFAVGSSLSPGQPTTGISQGGASLPVVTVLRAHDRRTDIKAHAPGVPPAVSGTPD